MKLHGVLFGLALMIPAASAAPVQTSNTINPGFWPTGYQAPADKNLEQRGLPTAAQMRQSQKQIALTALQREARDLQQQDGGTLSDEHRLMLQAKLDHINARWH